MPVEIKDLDEGRGNIFICSGIFSSKEYIYALERHLGQDHAKFEQYRFGIKDLSIEATRTNIII